MNFKKNNVMFLTISIHSKIVQMGVRWGEGVGLPRGHYVLPLWVNEQRSSSHFLL